MSPEANILRFQAVTNKSAGARSLSICDENPHRSGPARLSNCLDGPGRRAVIRNEVIDLYAFLFYQGGSRQLGMTFEQSYW